MTPNEWSQLGIGGLALGVIVFVVKTFVGAMQQSHTMFTNFLGNHMSKNTEALRDVTAALTDLKDEIRGRKN